MQLDGLEKVLSLLLVGWNMDQKVVYTKQI